MTKELFRTEFGHRGHKVARGSRDLSIRESAKETAMPAKRTALLHFDPNDLVIIGLDTKDGLDHELWDERIKLPLDESMVLNIMALGVKENVIVRHGPKGYEVVDGRRRVLHAREANRRLKKQGDPIIRVPATVELGDDAHMGKLAIALNEIRKDDDTLTKAEKCIRLLQRNGNDVKEAALIFGVSVAAIKNWAKVATLAPKVKRAVASGQISASAAAELHGIEKEAQIAKLEKLIGHEETGGKAGGKTRKSATVANAKRLTGQRVTVPKRVLLKLIGDKNLAANINADMVSGIKLALGMWLPPERTKLGHALTQAGFKYE